jgi:hypothetical protein
MERSFGSWNRLEHKNHNNHVRAGPLAKASLQLLSPSDAFSCRSERGADMSA